LLSGTNSSAITSVTQAPIASSSEPQAVSQNIVQVLPTIPAPTETKANAQNKVPQSSQSQLASTNPDPVQIQAQPLLSEEIPNQKQAVSVTSSTENSDANKVTDNPKSIIAEPKSNKSAISIHSEPSNPSQSPLTVASTLPQTSDKPIKSNDKINLVSNNIQITKSIKSEKHTSTTTEVEALFLEAKNNPSLSSRILQLDSILQVNPQFLPARKLQLETLIKTKAPPEELSNFVDDSLEIFPNNLLFKKTRAHLYIQQKNFVAAINVLENDNFESNTDSEYLALLAGSYAQLQRYPQAASIYLKLTQINADKAENWLGLAVSEDKLNQPQLAISAYQQALDKNTLQGEVVDYIKQRLQVLN
jgi:hypothetical protein